jgi:regulator of RNase E activity RraA
MKFNNRQDIIQLTPLWKGERFEDGRPKVSDDILRRMRYVTTEEGWGICWEKNYRFQWEGNWVNLFPERILVGRAVTGVFVPFRPDLHDYLMDYGHNEEGRIGAMNSWVIQTLIKDDVVVIDLFGKIFKGTYSGGNLSTAIMARTGRGQVIYGGIRDMQQIMQIPGLSTFAKGNDPTGIDDVTLVGLNTPCRIGQAICLPGDVVLGTVSGVVFIPPHLAEEVVATSEKTRMREFFGFTRLKQGIYNSSQMDSKWTPEIDADFADWKAKLTEDELGNILWNENPYKDLYE